MTVRTSPLLASELYALSQGVQCNGRYSCHWCSAPCGNQWFHDDTPPQIGVRVTQGARRPANPYICIGCWLFRRKRITVSFLRSEKGEFTFRDGQSPTRHSWFVTEQCARAIETPDFQLLYATLLSPPKRFFLSLLDNRTPANGVENRLHLQVANDVEELRADTVLHFSVNNVPLTYTVFELEELLTSADPEESLAGRSPGVHALYRLLGPYKPTPAEEPKAKRGRGRPITEDDRMLKSHREI